MGTANNSYKVGTSVEVFLTFLKLGLTSFGGPIAHIGFFRKELVERRSWLDDNQFAQLLGICQFLPGPASSQLGFCIGLLRAGWIGAFAAFIAFTLPSVLLLFAFASALPLLSGPAGIAVIQGLKLVACAVVADAVFSMAKTLCPDRSRQVIAVLTMAILLFISVAFIQLLVIVVAAIMGVVLLRNVDQTANHQPIQVAYGPRLGGFFLLLFILLLVGLPLFSDSHANFMSLADAFYRAGALVFGGGHVVLPLLEDSVVTHGWITSEQFLAAYGAAQAIPGPMFAFSAYLGALASQGDSLWLLSSTALCFMFLPGFLLVTGVLPFWQTVARHPNAARAIAGINAAVVGLLGAALYDPIITTGISNYADVAMAIVAFLMLAFKKTSPLVIVVLCLGASLLRTFLLG